MNLSLSIGIQGQVWYLIVSIPDLCTLTYFFCPAFMPSIVFLCNTLRIMYIASNTPDLILPDNIDTGII